MEILIWKSDGRSAKEKCNSNEMPLPAVPVTFLPNNGRETWSKKIEFILAVIGFAVDLGSIWRFSYICYANGGGAFLIPYCIMLIFGGLPLFYMELALGQYYKSSCITIWRHICPALKGIGYAICIINFYVGMHYNTIVIWAVYYLLQCYQADLPWIHCDNVWNTENCLCLNETQNKENYLGLQSLDITAGRNDPANHTGDIPFFLRAVSSPAKEYYERNVLELHLSPDLRNMGYIRWPLVLCVLIVFILTYFSLWKGIRSTGKAVWITVLTPYIFLFVLISRGVTLQGADIGINYYLKPKWGKLLTIKPPRYFSPLVLDLAHRWLFLATTSLTIIATSPGLIFIVFPEAIANMVFPNFWSIVFFFMLITLGLDSAFGSLEAIITALCDEYPHVLGENREIFVAALLIIVFIGSLPTCTRGGTYIVDFLTNYGPGTSVIFVVFVESAAVFWIYGADRFSEDIKRMIGKKPNIFWKICWTYISPVFILIILKFSFGAYEDMEIGDYKYLEWSIHVSWLLTLSSIICIPAFILYMFLVTPGSFWERHFNMVYPVEPATVDQYAPATKHATSV